LLRQLIKALRQKTKAGKSFADGWNDNLDLVIHLAKAYAERYSVENYLRNIANTDADIKPILYSLSSLYALTRIEADMGWFLSYRYFAALKARAIHHEINLLCKSLLPHAVKLVNAFGIPEHLIHAPIAFATNYTENIDKELSKNLMD